MEGRSVEEGGSLFDYIVELYMNMGNRQRRVKVFTGRNISICASKKQVFISAPY